MFKRLRNLTIVAVVAIGAAAFVRIRSTAQSPSTAPGTTVQDTSVVDQGDITLSVSASGSLQAEQNVSLAFPATGKVATLNVSEGDYVLKGQTLATLDMQTYRDAVAAAQVKVAAQQLVLRRLTDKPRPADLNVYVATLNLAKSRLASAKSGPDALQVQINALMVEKAKNGLWQAELNRDNINQQKDDLRKNPRTAPMADTLPTDNQNNAAITASSFDVLIAQASLAAEQAKTGDIASIANAEAQITSAQVALDNLLKGGNEDDVARAQAQVRAAQAALDLAKDNLSKATLFAPFDGVVAKLNLHEGENPPMGPAAIMLDTSRFYVDVPVDESDVSKISVGQPATLSLDALPGVVVNGKVSRIADTSTKTGEVVAYTIRIEIDPAGQPLRSAMSATATITTSQIKDVVRVRNRFVRLDRATNKAYAYVRQADGTFKEVEIVLGMRNETYSEVKSGLAAGDVLAVLQSNSLFLGPNGQSSAR